MMAVCNGSYYVCMSSKELPQLKTAFEVAGGHWQSFIIWIKNHFTLSRNDYQNQYEPILYGWNKNITNHYFIDDRTQGNVWLELGNKATYDGKYTEMTIGGLKVRLEGKVNGQILKGKRKIDIWRYDKPTKNPDHPTMKPVSMVIEALINSSHKGQSVLDPFGGSGTTLIAAEQTNRVCYMSELDPKYCDVIRKRYAKFIGQEDEWQTITKAL
jgi:DNA modification methylase